VTRRDLGFLLALALTVLGSALLVVQTKHENRTLVHELDQLRAEKARLETEWAQLQLEEATLAHHGRIEQLARDKLGMTEPQVTAIIREPAGGAPRTAGEAR
jgi:cell division protein FtsL